MSTAKEKSISSLLWYHLYRQNGELGIDIHLEVSIKVHSQIHKPVQFYVNGFYAPVKIQLEDEIERLL